MDWTGLDRYSQGVFSTSRIHVSERESRKSTVLQKKKKKQGRGREGLAERSSWVSGGERLPRLIAL